MSVGPEFDKHGVAWCSEDNCPEFDGKRCGATGFRPRGICEPWAQEAVAAARREGVREGAEVMREAGAARLDAAAAEVGALAQKSDVPDLRRVLQHDVEQFRLGAKAIRALPLPGDGLAKDKP